MLQETKITICDRDITLSEPTLLQLESATKKGKTEIEQIKHLLVDMSAGDLTIEDLNSMPLREFYKLSKLVNQFVGISESD